MKMKKTAALAIGAAASLVALAPTAASAQDGSTPPPTIANLLLSDAAHDDAKGFDRNWHDYDIVTQAVLAFPNLTAAVSDPNANLTVFAPTDAAFRRLVKDLTGKTLRSESGVFDAVVGLGLPTVETVLTYHILGAKVSAADAFAAAPVEVTTLQGGTIGVKINRRHQLALVDKDTGSTDPRVIAPDLGGAQANGFVHGIDRVLRPVDLPS
jgi:uncharacterized surface protein with fasciclin (FAS1) repeats